MTITILEPGPLSSVQDPFGRPGWRRYGVPVGGAADSWSARLANRLVGNNEGAALIEITLGGAAIALERETTLATTGGLETTLDGRPLPPATAVEVATGSVVRLEPGDGARGYLAIAGGIEVTPVLGSRSTDLRSGYGGPEGRALAAGDALRLGEASPRQLRWSGTPRTGALRVVSGPHAPGLDELCAAAWTVGVAADRAGVRLDGPAISMAPT